MIKRLSEHLYCFSDTCNVYVIVDGDGALLIDSGSGTIKDHLSDMGVRDIEWVLHTHHHRDQCWGDAKLRASGAKIAVPEYERYLFDQAELHWQGRRTFDNYNDRNTFFAVGKNIQVDAILIDYGCTNKFVRAAPSRYFLGEQTESVVTGVTSPRPSTSLQVPILTFPYYPDHLLSVKLL